MYQYITCISKMKNNTIRPLRLYRMVDGVRTPYVFTIDSRSTILDEQVDEVLLRKMQGIHITQDGITSLAKIKEDQELIAKGKANGETLDPDIEKFKKPPGEREHEEIIVEGVKRTKESVEKLITHVTPTDQKMLEFFTGTNTTHFPQHMDILDSYNNAIDMASKGGSCPSCVRGSILRQHIIMLKNRLGES